MRTQCLPAEATFVSGRGSTQRFTALDTYRALDPETVATRLAAGANGLSQAEAKIRLASFGPNQLQARPAYSRLRVMGAQLRNPLLLILVFAAVASAITGE